MEDHYFSFHVEYIQWPTKLEAFCQKKPEEKDGFKFASIISIHRIH